MKKENTNSKDKCECEICGKYFGTRADLMFHIKRLHDKLRPYKCIKCEKAFISNYLLETHVKIVHDKVYELDGSNT